ncbi:MAG: ParB/RepB/Spo0J family partition protein [Candidatus Caldarchaeum sp.]
MGEEKKEEIVQEKIPIDKLTPDPMNVRVDIGDVSNLMESIKEVGLLNPLIVRPLENGKYGVICGSRRLYALRALGWNEVPCKVVKYNDKKALVTSFTENVTQKTLNEHEKAAVYQKARQVAGSYRAAAALLGVSHEEIRRVLFYAGIDISDDIEVVDGRKKREPENKEAGGVDKAGGGGGQEKKQVSKKIAREAARVLKKLGEIGKKPDKEADSRPDEQASEAQPTIRDVAEKLDWRPKVFKSSKNSRPLHEILASPEARVAIPDKSTAKLSHEWARVGDPVSALVPVTSLDPPFQHIKVLLCPNCLAPLRGVSHGSAVVCFECGFPNSDVWRPA